MSYSFDEVTRLFNKGDLHALFNLIAEEYEKRGAEQEQDRIITLLTRLAYPDETSAFWIDEQLDDLIALIKGEK